MKKYAGWTLTCTAIASAMVMFPSVAETAKLQREVAHLQTRVETIQTVEAEGISAYVDNLANLQFEDAAYADLDKDAALTESLLTYRKDDFETVAEHLAEQTCLAEAVYYEARSETKAGQRAVAEVVLNRVASRHFPNTICGVVYQGSERRTGCQFTFTCDGSMERTPRGAAWERSQNMAKFMMSGKAKPITDRATHYHTSEISPHWSGKLRMTKRVGSHVFYRFGPRQYVPSTPTITTVAPPT